MNSLDSFLCQEITELKQQGLYRILRRIDSIQGPTVVIDGREVILLCSNNYLGLANHPILINAQIGASKEFGTGACASRLISGNMLLHERLEKRIAEFKECESAIVFSTGYMANLGVITSLVRKGDLVISDRLNHASIIDGIRLSGAEFRVYPHKDIGRLEQLLKHSSNRFRRTLIITDGIFSMDGDIAPLPEIIKVSKRFNAILMVDDAHATGVLGKTGRGTKEYYNIKEGLDIVMGTFSKAFASLGGFIAGSKVLIDYLRNKARSFIYSTGLPPSVLASSLAAIDVIEKEPELRQRLWKKVKRIKNDLKSLGFDTMESQTQIIPVLIGKEDLTMKMSELLFKEGILAVGIRPPSVPKGTSRIRVSIMAMHTDEHIERALEAFKKAGRKLGII